MHAACVCCVAINVCHTLNVCVCVCMYDWASLGELVHAVAAISPRSSCAHGSEEGCVQRRRRCRLLLLLLQGAHERRQRPLLPAGRPDTALLAVRRRHFLGSGVSVRGASAAPVEAAAGELHPAVQGQPGRPAHAAAAVRGRQWGWHQSGRTQAPLGLFWGVLLCWHCGLHHWWVRILLPICLFSECASWTYEPFLLISFLLMPFSRLWCHKGSWHLLAGCRLDLTQICSPSHFSYLFCFYILSSQKWNIILDLCAVLLIDVSLLCNILPRVMTHSLHCCNLLVQLQITIRLLSCTVVFFLL